MNFRYRPNPGFDKAFYNSPEARRKAEDGARAGAQIARQIAPVATGEYRDSITAAIELTSDGWKGHVIANAPHAMFVEFGTEDTPTFATLRRTGEVLENGR